MSSATKRLTLPVADGVAANLLDRLTPHCERIDLAGSLRRRCRTVGDIEIVCIPKPYDATPLFASGIAPVVNQWRKIKGELPCRYTARALPWFGLQLDLFMPDPRGYGLQLAIRTGSADWAHHILAAAWVRAGYNSKGGLLHNSAGQVVPTPDERGLFELIGLPWREPEERELDLTAHFEQAAARRRRP